MREKRHKNSFFLFVFLSLCISFMLLLEGMLRLVGVGYSSEPFERVPKTPYYRDNPDFLHKYYPGRKTHRSEAKYKNLFLVEKPTNGFRIFIIGGSTAQGWPFEPNQSFGAMIGVALQNNLSDRFVEVVNVAYSAMSSYYVADVVQRVFRYKPDVIVLYTGQNEYYGTLSVTTGSSYHGKWLYLALKEWRIFQLLFRLFERREDPSHTMMATQFAGKKLYPGERDEEVVRNFSRNLRRVFTLAKKHHIPVVVYEMAANLIHMPPFASQEEEKVRDLILAHDALFRRDTWRSKATKELLALWQTEYPSNAHVLYLDGLAKRARGEAFLDTLVKAKEHDLVPFRFREALRQALRKAVGEAGDTVIFIPLHEEILRHFGDEGFGRKLFIDHLHFNLSGQRFLAYLGTEKILSHVLSNVLSNQGNRRDDFFFKERRKKPEGIAHPYEVDEKVFLTFYDEFMALQNILTLLSQSPYREMLIPFPKDPAWGEIAMVKNPRFKRILDTYHQTKETQSFGNFVLFQLAKENDWETIEFLLEAYRHNNPGLAVAYQNLTEFLASRKRYEEALISCAMAYLLTDPPSRKPLETLGRRLASQLGSEDQWKTIVQLLAKNPRDVYNKTATKRRLQ